MDLQTTRLRVDANLGAYGIPDFFPGVVNPSKHLALSLYHAAAGRPSPCQWSPQAYSYRHLIFPK